MGLPRDDIRVLHHARRLLVGIRRRGRHDIRDGKQDNLNQLRPDGLPKVSHWTSIRTKPAHLLTSSLFSVCKSTAFPSMSSNTGNTPSPANPPCSPARNFKYSFTSLHAPVRTASFTNPAARSNTSFTTSLRI